MELLTEGALEMIMSGAIVSDPVVQILGSKKMAGFSDNERYRLLLSDGKFKVNVGLYSFPKHLEDPHELELYNVVKMHRYSTNVIKKDNEHTRVLLVMEMQVIARGMTVGHVIGNPVSLTMSETNSQQSDMTNLNGQIFILHQTKREVVRSIRERRVLTPISSLNPFHNNWVIKARVVNKSSIRSWANSNGEGKLFTVDLVDRGGEIRCTAFRELVDKFYELLEVDEVYYIARCVVKPTNRQFCTLKHDFEITMTLQTEVEKGEEDGLVIPQVKYNFTPIDKIMSMVNGTTIDIIGICKTVSELQSFTSKSTNRDLRKRELLLIDQSKTAVTLTLWNNDAETFTCDPNTTICLKNAKVQEFLGSKSLTMSASSHMKINPNIPESTKLKRWFETEGYHLEFEKANFRNGGEMPFMTFQQVRDSVHGDQVIVFQTFATISLIRLDRALYKSCPSGECQKKVVDLENGMYRCDKCNREYDGYQYRYLLSVHVSDESTSQWVTIFSREAEKILGKTANDIGVALANDQESVSKIFDDKQFQQYLMKCRAKLDTYNDEQRLKVTVISIENVNFEQHNAHLIKKLESILKN